MKHTKIIFDQFGSLPEDEQRFFLSDLSELFELIRNPENAEHIRFYNPAYRLLAPKLGENDLVSIVDMTSNILLNKEYSSACRSAAAFAIGKSYTKLGFDKIILAFQAAELPNEVVRQAAFAFDNLVNVEYTVVPDEMEEMMQRHRIPWDSAEHRIVVDDI